MRSMSLISLFKILIISITLCHVYIANGYERNVIDILEVVKSFSNESGFIPYVTLEPFSDKNVTTLPSVGDSGSDDESVKDDDRNDEKQTPIKKNILRWLPTRSRNRNKRSKAERQYIFDQEKRKKIVHDNHKKQFNTVMNTMKDNYWTTLYLYGEVARIRRQRVVMDAARLMIVDLELKGHERLRQKVLNCYRKRRFTSNVSFLDIGKPNNLIIRVQNGPRNKK